MPVFHPLAENPFAPESELLHAGKVFVFTPGVLKAVGATSSDGSDAGSLVNRFLLCLWDATDDSSLWITLQSVGEFEIPHAAKRLYSGVDANWMDEAKSTRHRDGTLWRLGRAGRPVKFTQPQQRAVIASEVERIRARISGASLRVFVPSV